MDLIWFVVAGLVLAVLTPPFKKLFSWAANAYATARSQTLAHQLAPYLVKELTAQLGLRQIREDLEYVKQELTINGGETVKDRVLSIENKLEILITDK